MKIKSFKKNIQFIAAFLAGSMIMGSISFNMANATDADVSEATTNGKRETLVTYDQGASFTVTIPKRIALDTETKSSGYGINVKGDIPSDAIVRVAPEDKIPGINGINFYMVEQAVNKKDDVAATVIQDETEWSSAEVTQAGTVKQGTISAPDLTSGSWEGSLVFIISFEENSSGHIHNYVDGICTECGAKEPQEEEHIHKYSENVIKEATCTEEGEKILTCECGDTKNESIPAAGHKYEDGNCTECGDIQAVYSLLRSTVSETSELRGFLGSTNVDSGAYRSKIIQISFTDYSKKEGHYLTDDNCWDVSEAGDGSIIAWLDSTMNGYKIYIAPAKEEIRIQAPQNASYMFANMDAYVYGLENVDFSGTTNMSYMFYHNSSAYGGVEFNVDTHNVTNVEHMFDVQSYPKGGGFRFGNKVDFSNVSNSNYMFRGQSNVTFINLPAGLTEIGEYMFGGCTSVTNISIPDSVTSIGNMAFSNCSSIKELHVPDSVTSIGSNAFYKVLHIYYNGTAEGAPWGALEIN